VLRFLVFCCIGVSLVSVELFTIQGALTVWAVIVDEFGSPPFLKVRD
jgi:hypothetical protein